MSIWLALAIAPVVIIGVAFYLTVMGVALYDLIVEHDAASGSIALMGWIVLMAIGYVVTR